VFDPGVVAAGTGEEVDLGLAAAGAVHIHRVDIVDAVVVVVGQGVGELRIRGPAYNPGL